MRQAREESSVARDVLRADPPSHPDGLESFAPAFQEVDQDVHAFLPEAGRFDRLKRESSALTVDSRPPSSDRPLLGVLIGVKDIFHVNGLPTHAGSKLPEELLHGEEGRAVRRLKEAGALVLGKTVTTEFAYFAPGPTRNPWNLAHTPGGSSSGSAAAVAAGLCRLALGTQTIGSVIRPAAFCGVFGYKPTFGRIPASGLIPLSPSLDHVGLLGSDIDILITAAKLVVSGWKNPGGFQQPVLGIPEGPYLERVSAAGLQNFHENIRRLEAAGYQVRRVLAFPEFEKIVNRHYLIVAAEAAKVHAGWYQSFKELYHQKTADLIERGDKVKTDDLVIARKGRTHLRDSLTELMEEHGIDLWIAPSAVDTAPEGLESTGDPVMNLPWTQAGVPVYSIPSGVSEEGLPFGLQVIGRFGADETLTSFVREMSQVVHPTDPV